MPIASTINRRDAISLIIPTCLLSVIVILVFHAYLVQTSKDLMGNWLQSESVNIAEGNLVPAVVKTSRALMSSSFVRGGMLVSRGDGFEDVEVEFGVPILPWDITTSENPGTVEVHVLGFNDVLAVYRFPNSPMLLLGLRIQSKFGALVLWSNLAALVLLFLAFYGWVSRRHLREERHRIELIGAALERLMSGKPGCSNLENIGGSTLSPAWTKLQGRFDTLKREIEVASHTKGILRTTQMLAHDIRKPFAMFDGMLFKLSKDIDATHQSHNFVQDAVNEITIAKKRVEAMLTDIMQAGSVQKINAERVRLEKLIEESCNYINWKSKNVDLHIDVPKDSIATVDYEKFFRVIVNVLTNALEATSFGGKIWIKVRRNKAAMKLTIGNSGSYIPPESSEKIFDLFYTEGKRRGTGLGLAICKKIVEAHQGSIVCESTVGRGTEFHITLPGEMCISEKPYV